MFCSLLPRGDLILGCADRVRPTLPATADSRSRSQAGRWALPRRIGYDTLDVGPLAEGWRNQRDTTTAYVMPYVEPGTTSDWFARPAKVQALRTALDEARRYRDM